MTSQVPDRLQQARRGTTWLREELLQLLTLAGTLAGLCITGVALFHTIGRGTLPGTLADDMLAISALVFLLCTYLIFFALRIAREVVALRVEKIIDALFLLGLTGMVASGMVMVYTVL
jgi:hypothetical protein